MKNRFISTLWERTRQDSILYKNISYAGTATVWLKYQHRGYSCKITINTKRKNSTM